MTLYELLGARAQLEAQRAHAYAAVARERQIREALEGGKRPSPPLPRDWMECAADGFRMFGL